MPQPPVAQINRIAHPALRERLQDDPEHAAENLVHWLQASVQAGLVSGGMGNHPADQARKRLLEEFVATSAVSFLIDDKEKRKEIPRTVGIRCLSTGSPAAYDVSRCDAQGRVFQHYMTDPHWRALYVGYKERNGALDRNKPALFWVNQVYAVMCPNRGAMVVPDLPADSPLRGRALGSASSIKTFLSDWQQAFHELCQAAGVVKLFRLTQGCVIEKTTGARFQLRNFDKSKPWMRQSPFANIRRVYRSPLRFWHGSLGR